MQLGHIAEAPGFSRRKSQPGKDADFPRRILSAIAPRSHTWEVIAPHELGETECSAWRRIQSSTPELANPFLAPEFTRAIGARNPDTRIAICEESGRITAFFPFHKQRRIGKAIGRHLSDFQGLIAARDFPLNVGNLLQVCDLDVWEFQNLLPVQAKLEAYSLFKAVSPAIDLRQGYEAYRAERRAAGTEQIKKAGNLARRLEKDFGPLRFEYDNRDPGMFKTLIDWRNRDLRRHNWSDGFHSDTVNLFARIHAAQSPSFAGVLSTLYAGDRLAAIHLGMRSGTRLHYWVPSYEPDMAKCSPGIVLLLKIAEAAARAGVEQIDLGPGNHDYKSRLANAYVFMIRGYLYRPSFSAAIRVLRTNTTSLLRKVSLDVPAKRLAGWLHYV